MSAFESSSGGTPWAESVALNKRRVPRVESRPVRPNPEHADWPMKRRRDIDGDSRFISFLHKKFGGVQDEIQGHLRA